jgi:hypothetical protein
MFLYQCTTLSNGSIGVSSDLTNAMNATITITQLNVCIKYIVNKQREFSKTMEYHKKCTMNISMIVKN